MNAIMKHCMDAATLVVAFTAAVAIGASATSENAATAPAAPVPSVRGALTLGGGLDLQKPDLSRAVVYIASDSTLDKEEPPKAPAIVAQRDKKFVPDFTVVSKNTTLEFPNEDPFDHNVFSRSKAAPAFDLDRYPKGMSKSRVFTEVGIVQVFCNIHPSMRAIIVVTPNHYFTRADGKGNFSIPGVPAGKYTLVAWQERCDELRKDIEVAANGLSDIKLELKESRQAIMSSEKTTGQQGYGLDRGLGVKQEKLNLPVVTDVHPAPVSCCDK